MTSSDTPLHVRARQGVRVPLEHAPREYVTDASIAEVPASAYYRRRLVDGDLVLAEPAAAPAPVIATRLPDSPQAKPARARPRK